MNSIFACAGNTSRGQRSKNFRKERGGSGLRPEYADRYAEKWVSSPWTKRLLLDDETEKTIACFMPLLHKMS